MRLKFPDCSCWKCGLPYSLQWTPKEYVSFENEISSKIARIHSFVRYCVYFRSHKSLVDVGSSSKIGIRFELPIFFLSSLWIYKQHRVVLDQHKIIVCIYIRKYEYLICLLIICCVEAASEDGVFEKRCDPYEAILRGFVNTLKDIQYWHRCFVNYVKHQTAYLVETFHFTRIRTQWPCAIQKGSVQYFPEFTEICSDFNYLATVMLIMLA